MFEWLSKDHVKQWWNDGDDTIEKVTFHYGKEVDNLFRFILLEVIETVEKPIGYFQYYLVSKDIIEIDQFIGEAGYVNRGVGEKTIKMFVELIMRRHQPRQIILDLSPENKRAIRCYEKVGFKHYETKKTKVENAAFMMCLELDSPID